MDFLFRDFPAWDEVSELEFASLPSPFGLKIMFFVSTVGCSTLFAALDAVLSLNLPATWDKLSVSVFNMDLCRSWSRTDFESLWKPGTPKDYAILNCFFDKIGKTSLKKVFERHCTPLSRSSRFTRRRLRLLFHGCCKFRKRRLV